MITREKSDKGSLKLNIKVSKEEWQKEIELSYERNKGKYAVQGFRKGKAPRKVIEKNYGDTVFYDDAFEKIVTRMYGEYLDQNPDIEPADYPRTVLNSMTDDGLDVTLTVELMPEVTLGELAFSVKQAKASVSDSEVEVELKKFVDSQARFEETSSPAENGDFVEMDFVGTVDGKEFEGGAAKDHRLELGSHTFIDGFEEQLVGVKAGESRTVKVKFPETYPVENLAGKNAEFKCDVHKVEKKKVPELNDKLVSFATEFASIDEYKASIKAKLLHEKEHENEHKMENDLIEALVAGAKVDIPQKLVESEKNRLVSEMIQRLTYQNLTLDMYLSYVGKTQQDFDKEQLEEAKRTLKTRLVLQKLIKDQNLQISHEEFHERLHEIAHAQNKSCEEVEKSLTEYEFSYIENDLLMNKIISFLKSKNGVKKTK